ncbi:CAP domain-containing protein [Kitasatospora sp. LaBMicrA B282]|uniref:CAP domain-containing protein n=1 Tax=Kitasatospora sp. LaBMicrA B282 TaxID=3420949 RepID=UPI003D098DF6
MSVTPQNGQVFTLKSANGTVADVSSSNTATGTRIQAWEPNGTRAQTWVFWAKEDGTWLLESGLTFNTHAPGQGMVMDYDYTAFNTHLYNESGAPNQRWSLEDTGDGFVRLRSARTDEGPAYLTADRVGNNLGVWKEDDSSAGQRWELIPVGTVGTGNQQAAPPVPPQQPSGSDIQGSLLTLLNNYRASKGLGSMRLDDRLTAVATQSSQEQARRHQQGHFVSLGDASKNAGYNGRGWGEVAGGAPGFWATADSIFQAWVDEPAHDAILRGNYTDVGAARTYAGDQTPYWSMVFALPM